MPESVTVLGYSVALSRADGGGQRSQAFQRALARHRDVNFLGVGPRTTDEFHNLSVSMLHRAKRRLLPVVLRGRSESEAAGSVIAGPTVSLMPSLNRFALRHGSPVWLDYPDLFSVIAANHAATVDPVSAISNRMQGWLWSRREAEEYRGADVVTVASLSHVNELGPGAVWLPTPVAAAVSERRRPLVGRSEGIVGGMIANFDYAPNRHAFDVLARQWLPVLATMTSKIIIAGFGSDRLPSVAGIENIGPVDDVADFYNRIDVALSPVHRGAGMKVKVVEAMLQGVPVLATSHSRDGLPDQIASECIDFDRLSEVSESDFASSLRDPRANPATAGELEKFTFASFQRDVDRLWQGGMTG